MLMLALKTCCSQQFYIFKFIINRKTLVAVLIHQTTLSKELITFALCAQVIRLYSGGLMTENMNSGGFLIVHKEVKISKR